MPDQDILVSPPRTVMEVFKMLPEGTLAEVIENSLYMSPTPLKEHQRVLRKLSTQFDLFVTENQLGEIFCSPLDVFLDEQANPSSLICCSFQKRTVKSLTHFKTYTVCRI